MGQEYIRRITVLGEVPSLGPVMLFDNMEDLFKWVEAGNMGDSVFEKIGTVAYNGSACLHMKSRTTGCASGDVIIAKRTLYERPGKRYRFEMLWRFEAKANCEKMTVRSKVYDGTYVHYVYLYYDAQNDKWRYTNSAGVDADVPGGAQLLNPATFHRLQMGWDQNSQMWVKMVSDGMEIDMSTLQYQRAASALAQRHELEIELAVQATTPVEGYVDDVLVMEV